MFARIAICDRIDVANIAPVVAWFQAHSDELNDQLPGYLGSQTLLDHESRRMIGIGLYDSEAHAQAVDAVVDQGPPPDMPHELQATLAQGEQTYRGVFEVVDCDGLLSASA